MSVKAGMPCYYDHPDCFGRRSVVGTQKICVVLRDTDFGTRDCPFYKPLGQVMKEREQDKKKGHPEWKD